MSPLHLFAGAVALGVGYQLLKKRGAAAETPDMQPAPEPTPVPDGIPGQVQKPGVPGTGPEPEGHRAPVPLEGSQETGMLYESYDYRSPPHERPPTVTIFLGRPQPGTTTVEVFIEVMQVVDSGTPYCGAVRLEASIEADEYGAKVVDRSARELSCQGKPWPIAVYDDAFKGTKFGVPGSPKVVTGSTYDQRDVLLVFVDGGANDWLFGEEPCSFVNGHPKGGCIGKTLIFDLSVSWKEL